MAERTLRRGRVVVQQEAGRGARTGQFDPRRQSLRSGNNVCVQSSAQRRTQDVYSQLLMALAMHPDTQLLDSVRPVELVVGLGNDDLGPACSSSSGRCAGAAVVHDRGDP